MSAMDEKKYLLRDERDEKRRHEEELRKQQAQRDEVPEQRILEPSMMESQPETD